MNKSEAGKLGAKKSNKIQHINRIKRIEKYMLNPTLCKSCNSVILYDKRKNKFCNQKCSAIYNNNCHKEIYIDRKYCNHDCEKEHQYKERIEKYKRGEMKSMGRGTIRRFLNERDGYKCNSCGIDEWNNKPIVLEIEHIDGNSENNYPDNFEYLCPNCHSQTDTYKSKNIGNGRHNRRVRYKNGQSF